jgi:uncharacterized protein YndB with AHSA1/START domain
VTPDDRFNITRTFAAPRELVFRAWTQPEHLAQWFGPVGFRMLRTEMDLRPGGAFLYGMQAPDGREMWGRWVFREIDPPEYLEFVQSFSDARGGVTRHPLAPEWPLEVLSMMRLTEAPGGRTTLSLTGTPHNASARESEVFFAATRSMEGGWTGTFDAFEAYLARLQATA